MKETCYYCYYHSQCSKFESSEFPICENWKPAVLPDRALLALYSEFLNKANALLNHVYSDTQRTAMKTYLIDKEECLKNALSLYKFAEMPTGTSTAKNQQYYNYMKKYKGR